MYVLYDGAEIDSKGFGESVSEERIKHWSSDESLFSFRGVMMQN